MLELTYAIPAYNAESTVDRTINSLLEQPGGARIIAVDDGSTDGTLDRLHSYGSKLKALSQSNAGPSAARNTALRNCESDFICFVDADDYVIGPHRQSVEQAISPRIDIVIGLSADATDDEARLRLRNKYCPSKTTANSLLMHFINDNCVQTSTLCWSVRFLRSVGAWDCELFGPEDIELAMRAFLQKPDVAVLDRPGWVVWHERSDSLSKTMSKRLATSQVLMHKKLLRVIESGTDAAVMAAFLSRCQRVARMLFLAGYPLEGRELLSLIKGKGPLKYSGPRLEGAVASLFGVDVALTTRSALGRIKRKVSSLLPP